MTSRYVGHVTWRWRHRAEWTPTCRRAPTADVPSLTHVTRARDRKSARTRTRAAAETKTSVRRQRSTNFYICTGCKQNPLSWIACRRSRGLTKLGEGRKLQFSDRQLHISTEKIMGAQNVNFAHKFPQNWGFAVPNLRMSGRKIFRRVKCRGLGNCPVYRTTTSQSRILISSAYENTFS